MKAATSTTGRCTDARCAFVGLFIRNQFHRAAHQALEAQAPLHKDTPASECPTPTACWWHGRTAEYRAAVFA